MTSIKAMLIIKKKIAAFSILCGYAADPFPIPQGMQLPHPIFQWTL